LAQGNLTAAQVGYINAHGTGTKANDAMEAKAIRRLLGELACKVYISSTKSLTGHTLGAAGSLELVATTLGMYYHFIPPMLNLQSPMLGYEDFKFVCDPAIEADFEVALSNSFAFGGNVASIAIRTVNS
jgi:3-oxoacyl-(acyl-carrier-protein) synthase